MNPNQPLISVLMPCYNAMPFLPMALDSIVNQTYKNLEIICINDGSTDETPQILEEYARKDSRIIVVHNAKNIKLIKTLNKGVGMVNGQYIARMDADDICVENRIEIQLQFMLEHPEIDVLSTGNIIIDEDGNIIKKSTPIAITSMGTFFSSFLFVPIGHPDVIGKTEVFKQNPYLDDESALHAEDYELWSRLLRKEHKLFTIPEYLLYFRKNKNSVSNLYTDVQDDNFAKCVQLHIYEYFNKNIPIGIIKVVCNRLHNKTTISNFYKGVGKIKKIKKLFIAKNKPEKHEIADIKNIVNTHLIDVFYQTFKRAGFFTKLFSLLLFAFNLKIIFNKTSYQYLKEKISKKI